MIDTHEPNRFALEVAAVLASHDEPARSPTTLPDDDDLNVPCRVCGAVSQGGNWRFPDGTALCDTHYLGLDPEGDACK